MCTLLVFIDKGNISGLCSRTQPNFYKILSTQADRVEKRVHKQLERIKNKVHYCFSIHSWQRYPRQRPPMPCSSNKVFFVSSRYTRDQNRSQYASLKTVCINEVNIFFSKLKSLRVHHIAHIRVAAPTKIKLLSFMLMPVNQFLSICVIDFGEVNLVAT